MDVDGDGGDDSVDYSYGREVSGAGLTLRLR